MISLSYLISSFLGAASATSGQLPEAGGGVPVTVDVSPSAD